MRSQDAFLEPFFNGLLPFQRKLVIFGYGLELHRRIGEMKLLSKKCICERSRGNDACLGPHCLHSWRQRSFDAMVPTTFGRERFGAKACRLVIAYAVDNVLYVITCNLAELFQAIGVTVIEDVVCSARSHKTKVGRRTRCQNVAAQSAEWISVRVTVRWVRGALTALQPVCSKYPFLSFHHIRTPA